MYRHHKFKDGLLRSLDPNVATAHDMFEGSGVQDAVSTLESPSNLLQPTVIPRTDALDGAHTSPRQNLGATTNGWTMRLCRDEERTWGSDLSPLTKTPV